MDPNLRNLKDFLGLYNKVTELCFLRCVDNLSDRKLDAHEDQCVHNCVNKFARFNQSMMNVYVQVQTEINERRLQEIAEKEKLSQAANQVAAVPAPAATVAEKATTPALA